jgi:hypothetical protein
MHSLSLVSMVFPPVWGLLWVLVDVDFWLDYGCLNTMQLHEFSKKQYFILAYFAIIVNMRPFNAAALPDRYFYSNIGFKVTMSYR